jgi:hypothetical protein
MLTQVSRQLIGTIDSCQIYAVEKAGVLRVEWVAKMAVCNDGTTKNPEEDPCHQDETAYYNNGKFLDPYKVPYIVVPPLIIEGVDPVVLGCHGAIINLKNGLSTPAICGEVGPDDEIGEASVEAAERCGLSGSPIDGGTDEHTIAYVIWPGLAAHVDGVVYKLQPS